MEVKSSIKKCNKCGKEHFVIPGNAQIGEWGVFWNCECESTLFLPLALIPEAV